MHFLYVLIMDMLHFVINLYGYLLFVKSIFLTKKSKSNLRVRVRVT